MKSTDLRIGNFIYWLDVDFNKRVMKVDIDDIADVDRPCNDDEYEPIELDEEWLLDLGFVKDKVGDYTKDKLTIVLKDIDKFHKNGRVYYNSWAIMERQPDAVHQLQNLYFALTGEELTL